MPLLFSLKRALTLNFLLVAAVPVLLFGLFSIQLMSSYQLDGLREINISKARSIAEEVDSFLLEVRSDLRNVEQVLATRELLRAGRTDDFLASVVRNSLFFESIYLLDTQYRVVSLGVLPKMSARSDDYVDLDFSGHQLFRSGLKLNGAVWSNTFVSLVTGEPSVTIGVPLPGGFLLGNIRLSSLGKLLQRYSLAGVEVSIVDQRGTLIAHNQPGMAMQRVNFADHPVVNSALQGVAATRDFNRDGKHSLESASPVETSDWVVLVGLDMNVVQTPIHNMRNLLICFMAVALLLACVIALLNVRRLMTPLIALGNRTSLIADGHYEVNFRPSGFVEIDELANRITSMTHAIKIREESIINNERRFRDLVNSIDGIVWEMEYPSFRFLFVSQQAEAILGYPLQDWYDVDSFWDQKVHAEDRAQTKAYCQLMSEKHEDHDFEYRMIAADGRLVWIRDLVTVVVENNRPVRLLGVMIDVTTQKELLEDLSHSEQNYREANERLLLLIERMPLGCILWSPEFTVNMWNPAAEAIFGYNEGEMLGRSPFDVIVAGELRAEIQAFWPRLMSGETSAHSVNGNLTKSGDRIVCEWYNTPVYDGAGDIIGVISMVQDVTERKAADEELELYRIQLEDLVQKRTEQLENTQKELVQQERLAVLGQLTATVSHEIRNPLGTVANSLYLLKNALQGDAYTHLARPLQLAERNVERCDSIISDLLDFSRQRKIVKVPVVMDEWLAELLHELTFPDDVNCHWLFASEAVVMIDPERLRRAIVNVVTNALQALAEVPDADKILEIKTRVVSGRCEIAVHDSGPGMSEEIMARIFEPMFSTKNFGVGLGVPIIKNIIEGHGGEVIYCSAPGKGTTVKMLLPLE